MPLRFVRFKSCNRDLPLTVERIFQLYGAWGGIHDFDFEDAYTDDSMTVTGPGGSAWGATTAISGLPPNISFTYHKNGLRQGVEIKDPTANVGYKITTDASGYVQVWAGVNTVFTAPIPTPTEADVEVVFRQQLRDDRDDIVWHSFSLYMNGALIFTYSQQGDLNILEDVHIGFCAYHTDSVTYTNIRVPELCEIAEFGTLDPGESAAGGLQRTIEGRYLKFFCRWDGALRAWRKKQRDLFFTFSHSVDTFVRSIDLSQLVTHARMRGAYVEGEYHDPALTELYMHRFAEVDNSMLFTRRECQTEAENTVRRAEESAFSAVLRAHWVPLLEPEDRIFYQGSDWIVSGYSLTGGSARIDADYTLRKYVWGG